MPLESSPLDWKPFVCDGQAFEWLVANVKEKTRPAEWPAHEPSPGRATRSVLTVDDAVAAVRRFWALLNP